MFKPVTLRKTSDIETTEDVWWENDADIDNFESTTTDLPGNNQEENKRKADIQPGPPEDNYLEH